MFRNQVSLSVGITVATASSLRFLSWLIITASPFPKSQALHRERNPWGHLSPALCNCMVLPTITLYCPRDYQSVSSSPGWVHCHGGVPCRGEVAEERIPLTIWYVLKFVWHHCVSVGWCAVLCDTSVQTRMHGSCMCAVLKVFIPPFVKEKSNTVSTN